jgi:phospholipid/cholesterol/gamma-HCH transport system permease protein
MGMLETTGRLFTDWLDKFGDFCRFMGQTQAGVPQGVSRPRSVRLLLRQMYHVGVQSLPVMMITGMFVGMVLAVQTATQFKDLGLEGQLGAIVNLSVLRELGPVLSGVLLAGRIGGAMAAELGTMRVTEQIDALRAMGANPIRHLVVPRFLASLLLGPALVIFADIMGIFGGYYISVQVYNINPSQYWVYSGQVVEFYDIFSGLLKGFLFSGSMALICCYKGFRSQPGAAGVGRACTEAFVLSCMTILAIDFFLNVLLNTMYVLIFGAKSVYF